MARMNWPRARVGDGEANVRIPKKGSLPLGCYQLLQSTETVLGGGSAAPIPSDSRTFCVKTNTPAGNMNWNRESNI